MTEYDFTTLQGLQQFRADHFTPVEGALFDLDNLMHEYPDLVTIDQVQE